MSRFSLKKHIDQLSVDHLQHVEAVLSSEGVKTVAANILIVAGVVGAVGLLFTAPNALKLFAPILRRKYKRPLNKKEQKEKLLKVFYYLKQTGQIQIEEKGSGLLARLTPKGYQRFKKIRAEVKSISRPERWNGLWWLVASDVPVKSRVAADMFRLKLRELQFYPLQRTLWLYPFDPRAELEYVVNKYHIGQFVTVMEVNRIDLQDKQRILSYFKKRHIL